MKHAQPTSGPSTAQEAAAPLSPIAIETSKNDASRTQSLNDQSEE